MICVHHAWNLVRHSLSVSAKAVWYGGGCDGSELKSFISK